MRKHPLKHMPTVSLFKIDNIFYRHWYSLCSMLLFIIYVFHDFCPSFKKSIMTSWQKVHKGSHALGSKGEVAEAFSQSVYGAVTRFGWGAHSMRLMTHTNTQIQQNVQLDKTKIQLKQNQIQPRFLGVSIDRLGLRTQVITHKNFFCEETSNSQCSLVGLFNCHNSYAS